jgi:deoxyribodipyrimidine photo-lyase
MIEAQRIQLLNEKQLDRSARFLVYWMQASQRVSQNEALVYAVELANSLNMPLLVYFGLSAAFNEASIRHYRFLAEGLLEVQQALKERSISMVVHQTGVVKGLKKLIPFAAGVVVDRGYTRTDRQWRKEVAEILPVSLIQVESNVVVPIESVSDKEEYSAATLRRKIEPMIDYFAQPVALKEVKHSSLSVEVPFPSANLSDLPGLFNILGVKDRGGKALHLRGGEGEAQKKLSLFLAERLDGYATKRNDPSLNWASGLSPYLHFGQISPVDIYHQVRSYDLEDVPVFLEELIVRRELAMNYVYFNPLYDQYEGLPSWALKTLAHHEMDRRPYRYTYAQLEAAQTHDPYWNAAQKEMVECGTMHNYLRMYWGKKILEWSGSPKEAFVTALSLNNRYQMDGRDPNGYAGVAWCFGKHDRPWAERVIFGNVRYMNDKGLERKFNIQAYVNRIEAQLKS